MNAIEQKAIEIFQNNLDYFAKEQPNLYKKIDILNQAIESGAYNEKYSLEYINDSFDVLEIKSNHYLYNKNSTDYSKLLLKQINYKKSDSVIETFYNQNVSEEQVKYWDGKVPITDPLYATAKIIHYANSVTSKKDEMKYITKFIFAGIGLGLHINNVIMYTKASYVFILEDNLELFRLSLFTTDYSELSTKTKLFFSIMDNEHDFKESFGDYFMSAYNNNHYLKYVTFSQNDISKIKEIQKYIITSQYLSFPYSSHLKELLKAPEYLIQNYPFINTSIIHSDSPFANKPVLLIASGPSLGNNEKWLQMNKEKFFIVTVLSSVKTLYKLGVKPDVVVHIDSQARSINLLDGVNITDFFDNTFFIFSSVLSRNMIDKFPKDRVFCIETASHYKQNFGTLTAPSIGETTYALSLIFATKELYLLGLDLALDPETKQSHSKEHMDGVVVKEESKDHENYTTMKGTIFYTKGNFLKEVPTTPVYNLSVLVLNSFSKNYLINNQKVYNLSNGAYLEGTIPLHPKDFKTEKFTDLSSEEKVNSIRTFLDSISESSVNQLDIDFLDVQIREAQRLLSLVQEFKKVTSTSNYESYMVNFYLLSTDAIRLYKDEKHDINIILYTYLHYVSSYIFDIFNTKGLKNSKRHLKKINSIFIEQLIKILDLYLTTMLVYRKFM